MAMLVITRWYIYIYEVQDHGKTFFEILEASNVIKRVTTASAKVSENAET